MSQLCYTLEEAAAKLNLTEPVLVRLSQYFREPKAAYEETGFLSFKGDLVFEEADLAFFRKIRERLLTGLSLDAIRREMKDQGSSSGMGAQKQGFAGRPDTMAQKAGIREIADEKPYERAVEKSFARYKSIHHPGGGKVFESILREINPDAPPVVKSAGHGGQERPTLRQSLAGGQRLAFDADAQPAKEAAPDATRDADDTVAQEETESGDSRILAMDTAWESVMRQAAQNPRSLNTHLKNAALLLREKVTRRHAMMPVSARTRDKTP